MVLASLHYVPTSANMECFFTCQSTVSQPEFGNQLSLFKDERQTKPLSQRRKLF